METSRQAVEQNLAEIAFASVSEKTPALMDYYLGFDLVEKNDEGTRAAGLMGFKIGKQLLYVPVFFLNGKLKGTEVLYLKNSDIFVTNTEQWVSYIIGQEQQEQGEAESLDNKNTDSAEVQKALDLFVRPPASATKTASIEDFSLSTVEDFLDKNAAFRIPTISLKEFVKRASREDYVGIVETIATPEIFEQVLKVYSPIELKEIIGNPPERQKTAQQEENSEVELIDDLFSKEAAEMTESDRKKLYESGYFIKNAKSGEEASKLYFEEERQKFQEVTESGIYKVLNKAGKLVEAAVFVNVCPIESVGTARGGRKNKIVVDPSSGKFCDTDEDVFYSSGNEVSKVKDDIKKEILSGAKEVSSAQVNKTYVIISPNFEVYGPFEVTNKVKVDGRYVIGCTPAYRFCSCDSFEEVKIKIIDAKDRKIGRVGDAVYVPSDYKLFELQGSGYGSSHESEKIQPGSFSSVIDAVCRSGAEKALFEKSGFDVVAKIGSETFSFSKRKDLVFHLCSKCGFSEASAEKVASEMYENKKTRLKLAFVKSAYPDPSDPNTAAGTTRTGTPQEQAASTTQEMIPPNGEEVPATDPSFGNWKQPDPEQMALLERAADADSREVFDPAMIGILVRTTRAQSMVQEYIPEFVDNLDRMIRLLLLFYWHNAEFAENYGIDQMSEFEDLLLSTIKNTGKTILFLKQKAVKSSVGRSDVL